MFLQFIQFNWIDKFLILTFSSSSAFHKDIIQKKKLNKLTIINDKW